MSKNLSVWVAVLLLVSGCAVTTLKPATKAPDEPTSAEQSDKSEQQKQKVVLLIEPDVELSEMQASGLSEPKADWTDAARKHIDAVLDEFMQRNKSPIIRYQPPADDLATEQQQGELIKLHEAVGGAVALHGFIPAFALPAKKGTFDWTLGNGVQVLGKGNGADYALFLTIRDSYASAGRAALMVGAAILGVGLQGGTQIGYASLVDLKTGEIIWFNRLARGSGDLRQAEPARETIETLLTDFPI